MLPNVSKTGLTFKTFSLLCCQIPWTTDCITLAQFLNLCNENNHTSLHCNEVYNEVLVNLKMSHYLIMPWRIVHLFNELNFDKCHFKVSHVATNEMFKSTQHLTSRQISRSLVWSHYYEIYITDGTVGQEAWEMKDEGYWHRRNRKLLIMGPRDKKVEEKIKIYI